MTTRESAPGCDACGRASFPCACDPVARFEYDTEVQLSRYPWDCSAAKGEAELWPDGTVTVRILGRERRELAQEYDPTDFADAALCDDCGRYAKREACEMDDAGIWCERCREAQEKEAALAAGIPLSVIEGRSKLSDHFSADYIRAQIDPKAAQEGGAS